MVANEFVTLVTFLSKLAGCCRNSVASSVCLDTYNFDYCWVDKANRDREWTSFPAVSCFVSLFH